ncbi:MAG: prolyl oligopeptidase family serine peptidase [Bacteroidetes bacterium]|jgi:prolyl oligopeptidase|nr:prolyl oligopeptidase family serine peptidase [Bacteroidota bacterium]
MRVLFLLLLISLFISCQNTNEKDTKNPVIKVDYPDTKKVDVSDNYHGTVVKDPYRWLEVDTAAEVEEWVKRQNEVTFGYLDKIPYTDSIADRFEELYNYPKLSSPYKAGEYYFFYKNDGLQNQSVIYRQYGLDGEPEVFIDPNEMNPEGTTAVSLVGFSEDYKYVTYSVQEAGSDWQTFYVKDVETGETLSDVLKWVKFSGASWVGNGFYYSRYPAPESGLEYSAENKGHAVYYHQLGDDQEDDRLVYGDPEHPKRYHFVSVTEDRKILALQASTGTDGYETYIRKLEDEDDEFSPLQKGFEFKNSVIHHSDGQLWVRTNRGADNYRLVKVDVNTLDWNAAEEIIPESKHLLSGVSTGGGKLFAKYLEDASTHVYAMEYDGSDKNEIELPGVGSAGGFSGRENHKTLFYTFTSFTRPPSIFSYDVETGTSELFFSTELKFDPEKFVEKQVTYTSKDGIPVSMFIVHKKDLKLDGNNPTYLYGYGGFNISLTPSFSSSRLILLENGGVFAMPNLRGGGEYGEEWHQAGMLLNKQNVFDDFIYAAKYLIDEKYTSSKKLAIAGGSNGGLLVGAAMTQKPDLFAVAFPAVGVLDMLRYHKFTVGWGWVPEYGSSDDSIHFENLYSYSPLHQLKDSTSYPATLITTADHDDRVVPAHSFKFAARLQEAHKGQDPVLIRIEVDAGHGAGKPTSKIIEEQAQKWAFFFYNTNSPVTYEE